MKRLLTLLLLAFVTVATFQIDDADARRFGGGKSFGSQRSFNQPRQPAMNQPAMAGKPAASPMRSGLMGMLGGLALGGLLGALFFGGAFDGINLFDIVLIGAIAFALIWFFKRKAESAAAHHRPAEYATSPAYGHAPQPQNFGSGAASQPAAPAQPASSRVAIDEKHFLAAAKEIFVRMQAAWDAGNLGEIRTFTTPELANSIADELKSLGNAKHTTEVLMLNGSIQDTWVENDADHVAVLFQAMMREREEGLAEQQGEVREIWIFRRPQGTQDPTWFLSGIQQLQ